LFEEERLMLSMRLLRALSALIEVSAVVVMFRLSRLESLVRLNAALGLVGPVIFLLVSAIGLIGLAQKLNPLRFLLVLSGVCLVLIGTRS
jgi:hypothetical protein